MKPKQKFIPALIIAAVCLLPAAIYFGKQEKTYLYGLEQLSSGENMEAYRTFLSIEKYKDAGSYLQQMRTEDPLLPFCIAEKGSLVDFGHYEQDNDLSNGMESIQWLILDRIGEQILLLSSAALEAKPYHTESFDAVTWEESTLREWMNGYFYHTAFDQTEQKIISSVRNRNPDQSAVGTKGGADTLDRVFLLSESEAKIYFGNEIDQDMIGTARATEYVSHQDIETDEQGHVCWWLRSPGVYPYSAQFVDQEGKIYISGAYTDIDYQFAVRPAIWLDLKDQL